MGLRLATRVTRDVSGRISRAVQAAGRLPGWAQLNRQVKSAIWCKRCAGDVARVVGTKKHDRVGDLFGLAHSSRMDALRQKIFIQFVAQNLPRSPVHGRIDHARANQIDSDTP